MIFNNREREHIHQSSLFIAILHQVCDFTDLNHDFEGKAKKFNFVFIYQVRQK